MILDKACKRYPYGWNVRRQRLAVLYFRLGQCYLEDRNLFKAIGHFILAGLLDPVRGGRVLIEKNTDWLH